MNEKVLKALEAARKDLLASIIANCIIIAALLFIEDKGDHFISGAVLAAVYVAFLLRSVLKVIVNSLKED